MSSFLWRALIVGLLACTLPAPAASGWHVDDCEPTSSPTTAEAAGHYVIFESHQPDGPTSIWMYRETNGIDGLQRADEVHDDTCHGRIPGDTIWI